MHLHFSCVHYDLMQGEVWESLFIFSQSLRLVDVTKLGLLMCTHAHTWTHMYRHTYKHTCIYAYTQVHPQVYAHCSHSAVVHILRFQMMNQTFVYGLDRGKGISDVKCVLYVNFVPLSGVLCSQSRFVLQSSEICALVSSGGEESDALFHFFFLKFISGSSKQCFALSFCTLQRQAVVFAQ